jgi:hypothetical protein
MKKNNSMKIMSGSAEVLIAGDAFPPSFLNFAILH